MQPALDPALFQNSASGAEGATSGATNLEEQLEKVALRSIDQQRTQAEQALNGDAAARTELLNNPTTLPEVKAAIEASSGSDPAALAQANSALDAAAVQARNDAPGVGQAVTAAVKAAFATSVTRIYLFAIPLSLVALAVIAIWLPEIPLSKGRPLERLHGE
jgi:hypothetical protein